MFLSFCRWSLRLPQPGIHRNLSIPLSVGVGMWVDPIVLHLLMPVNAHSASKRRVLSDADYSDASWMLFSNQPQFTKKKRKITRKKYVFKH